MILMMCWKFWRCYGCKYDELSVKKDADSVVAGIKTKSSAIDVNFLGGELGLIHSQFWEKVGPVRLEVCVLFMHAESRVFKPC
jgi:hypothetical protein